MDELTRMRRLAGLKPLLTGGLSTTLGTSLLIQIVTVGSGVVLARGLGPEGRGDLATILLWPGLIAAICAFGLAEATTYFSSHEDSQGSATLVTSFVIGLVQSACGVALAYVALPFILVGKSQEMIDAAHLYVWCIPLNLALTLYPGAVLQGRMRVRAFNVARFLIHGAYTVGLLGLWAVGSVSVEAAVQTSLAAHVCTFALCLWYVCQYGYWRASASVSLGIQMLSFGMRLHVGNVAAMVAQRLDIIVLSLLATPTALGLYVVAGIIGAAAGLIPNAVSLVLFPRVTRTPVEERPRLLVRILWVGAVLSALILPAALLTTPTLLAVFFGARFEGSALTAEIVMVGQLARGWSLVLTAFARGAGEPFQASVAETVGVTVLGLLLVPLVWWHAELGAAIAVSAAALVTFVLVLRACLAMTDLHARQVAELVRGDTAATRAALVQMMTLSDRSEASA